MKKTLALFLGGVVILVLVGGYYLVRRFGTQGPRDLNLIRFLRDPASHADWLIRANTTCGDAPFSFPTTGYIGYLWDDSFRPGHRHQGIDIFGGEEAGITPIYAAYAGYLTRLPEWKSTVIVRVPSDPLRPGEQIWLYYTHMADSAGNSFVDEAFAPGTYEVFIEAGTRLGRMGNYSGTSGNPTGVHLHFSIVRDAGGKFLNELEIENTLDPSPYLGMPLNAKANPPAGVITCSAEK